uniref:Uncharacterized protein n=1 Tax=Panagrolaimus sp. JU765 TaxID=591449 RepID=A0AC34PV01_9BILA
MATFLFIFAFSTFIFSEISGFDSFVYKNAPPEMIKAAKQIGQNERLSFIQELQNRKHSDEEKINLYSNHLSACSSVANELKQNNEASFVGDWHRCRFSGVDDDADVGDGRDHPCRLFEERTAVPMRFWVHRGPGQDSGPHFGHDGKRRQREDDVRRGVQTTRIGAVDVRLHRRQRAETDGGVRHVHRRLQRHTHRGQHQDGSDVRRRDDRHRELHESRRFRSRTGQTDGRVQRLDGRHSARAVTVGGLQMPIVLPDGKMPFQGRQQVLRRRFRQRFDDHPQSRVPAKGTWRGPSQPVPRKPSPSNKSLFQDLQLLKNARIFPRETRIQMFSSFPGKSEFEFVFFPCKHFGCTNLTPRIIKIFTVFFFG